MVSRLHEREGELEIIVAALEAAGAGRGAAVVVEGPAGIGKTSLLERVREEGRARSFAVAGARASDLEVAYAWGIVRQLFEPRLRGMSSAARNRTLSGAAALAGPVVLPEAPAVEADASFGVLHGLYWLVAALVGDRPQLLIVDDLHWADVASRRFLEFLANRIDTMPALLLVAQRPGSHASLPTATSLALAPLSLEATGAVLGERDGGVPAESFVAACHSATGGNPLLVRRLAEGLGELDDPAAVADRGPELVAREVNRTLARLGGGSDRLARAVAVLDRAPLRTAAQLAGIDARQAPEVAEQLVRAGILRNARPLEFEHALVRDAVLAVMTAGERAQLHADAARLLADAGAAAPAIAVHLLRTEPRGDEEAAATLAEAGRRALASGAPSEAAAAMSRALQEPPPASDRHALLIDLARAEHGLGRPEALDHVREAFRTADDEVERAEAALALMWATGPGQQDPQEAYAMLEQALAGVAGRHRELELQLEAVRLTAAFLSAEVLAQMVGSAERFADLEGRTTAECLLLPHVAFHRFLLGQPAADVAEPLERAVADPEILAGIGPDSAWLDLVLSALFKTDRLDVARRTVDVTFADAQRRGSAPGFVTASAWRAWIALREGSAADAEADARAAFAVPAPPYWEVFSAACLIEVLVDRGRLDEAQDVLVAAGGADAIAADRASEGLLYVRSILRTAQGDVRGALADQLEARRRIGEDLPVDPDYDGRLRTCRLLHATGDVSRAAEETDAALAWARTWDTPGYIGQALTVSGLIHDDVSQLREAVEHLERSPARRELAVSLVELGAALRRHGERSAAREPLRRAIDIAASGGLVAIEERAREELRVTGARLRRAEATGLAALTPSERRIAELAAGGATNAEIAQGLFVTVKTVEMHLGNAYRKLGISSRRQLEPLVRAEP